MDNRKDGVSIMIYNDNFERTKKYAEAFWSKELIDRPYVCVTSPKKGCRLPTEGVFASPATAFEACVSGNYRPILDTAEEIARNTFYGGEALPDFQVQLGPDQYAGFLGAKIAPVPGSDTTWANPIVEDWDEFPVALDKSEDGYFRKAERFIQYVAKNYADKFLIDMFDLHGNMDALSALRGPQDLCYDLIDCPESVLATRQKVDDTYAEVYNMIFNAGKMAQRGTIGWSPVYCAGRSAVIQCDYICMISPAQGKQFVLPAIEREAAFLDRCIYHYDGKEALVHLDNILAIRDIDCIQWVPGAGNPRSIEWMDLLKKTQKAGKSLWIFDWTAEEIKRHFRELEPNKVAFSLSVDSQDEAEELLDYLVKNT